MPLRGAGCVPDSANVKSLDFHADAKSRQNTYVVLCCYGNRRIELCRFRVDVRVVRSGPACLPCFDLGICVVVDPGVTSEMADAYGSFIGFGDRQLGVDSNDCNDRLLDYARVCSMSDADALRLNRIVEWTQDGGQCGHHSSMLSAPLRPIHGRR